MILIDYVKNTALYKAVWTKNLGYGPRLTRVRFEDQAVRTQGTGYGPRLSWVTVGNRLLQNWGFQSKSTNGSQKRPTSRCSCSTLQKENRSHRADATSFETKTIRTLAILLYLNILSVQFIVKSFINEIMIVSLSPLAPSRPSSYLL